MAVLSTTEVPNTQADIVNHTYTRTFIVILDNNLDFNGAFEAAGAVGIVEDDLHPQDSAALCNGVNAFNMGMENSKYQVDVTYAKQVSGSGSGSQNPASRPTTWSYRAVPINATALHNYHGIVSPDPPVKIQNSAEDLFEEITTVNKYHLVCIATDYDSTFTDALAVRSLLGTTNKSAETLGDVSIGAGEGLFTGFNAQEVEDSSYGSYFVKTYEFTVDVENSWIIEVRNRGLKEKVGTGIRKAREIIKSGKHGGDLAGYVDLTVGGIAIRDGDGRIDSSNPNYISVLPYPNESWSSLSPI